MRNVANDFETWARLAAALRLMTEDERRRTLTERGLLETWPAINEAWSQTLNEEIGRGEMARPRRYKALCAAAIAARRDQAGSLPSEDFRHRGVSQRVVRASAQQDHTMALGSGSDSSGAPAFIPDEARRPVRPAARAQVMTVAADGPSVARALKDNDGSDKPTEPVPDSVDALPPPVDPFTVDPFTGKPVRAPMRSETQLLSEEMSSSQITLVDEAQQGDAVLPFDEETSHSD